MMRRRVAYLVLAAGLAACGGGDSPAELESLPPELLGRWIAQPECRPSCGFTFYDPASPADSTNFTAGGSVTLLVLYADAFSFEIDTRGTARIDSIGGGIQRDGATLVTAGGDRIDYSLSGGRLVLNWAEFAAGTSTQRARGAFVRP